MAPLSLRTPGDIGALIKGRRRALGLDQAALAARIGVSRLWVNQVERGKPGAGVGLVLRALAAVGVELSAGIAGKATTKRVPGSAPDIDDIVARARARTRA